MPTHSFIRMTARLRTVHSSGLRAFEGPDPRYRSRVRGCVGCLSRADISSVGGVAFQTRPRWFCGRHRARACLPVCPSAPPPARAGRRLVLTRVSVLPPPACTGLALDRSFHLCPPFGPVQAASPRAQEKKDTRRACSGARAEAACRPVAISRYRSIVRPGLPSDGAGTIQTRRANPAAIRPGRSPNVKPAASKARSRSICPLPMAVPGIAVAPSTNLPGHGYGCQDGRSKPAYATLPSSFLDSPPARASTLINVATAESADRRELQAQSGIQLRKSAAVKINAAKKHTEQQTGTLTGGIGTPGHVRPRNLHRRLQVSGCRCGCARDRCTQLQAATR